MLIYYYTNLYPFGNGNRWKEQEISYLANRGFKINVIPFWDCGMPIQKNLNSSVLYEAPLLGGNPYISLKRKLIRVFFSRYFFYFFSDILHNGSIWNRSHIVSWIVASYNTLILLRDDRVKKVLKDSNSEALFYFYWGLNAGYLIPFLKKKGKKILCRFHGYDLYCERNNGYLPFQSAIVNNSALIMPCSEDGAKYLRKKYPKFDLRIYIARLGTTSIGLANHSEDDVLHLLSCSSVIPVKRVELILESLEFVKSKVKWTHIGGGFLLESLRSRVQCLNMDNVHVDLLGEVPPIKVQEYYKQFPVDLFLNVSEYEGVPVSIMEALSAGIPVYASNVGGTSEIVDDSVGRLFNASIAPRELAALLDEFNSLDKISKAMLRTNAFRRYEEMCDMEKRTDELAIVFKMLNENKLPDCYL